MMGTVGDALIPLVDEGLGNSAYLLDLGDGRALAVDPPRDLRELREAAARRNVTVAFVADTHLHADFLSGAVQLAADDGAQILASAAGKRQFPHRGLVDGDEIDLGGLTLHAIATPGHTDEHLSFQISDGSTPIGVFTGGSLIVGAAARTDLLGPERTAELTRAQYASLQRLARLPDATAVWPTHGAGSFCTAPLGADRTSTIGGEKAANPLLAAPNEDAFTAALTATLGSYPTYFARLADANRRGPAVITAPLRLPDLSVERVRRLVASGATIVDVRPVDRVADGHIPGAIAIPLRAQFATWLGWLVDPTTPIIIVRDADQDPVDIMWRALNIDYDPIIGELAGGMAAWTAAGGETVITPIVAPAQVAGPVLDVRQDSEYVDGHVPGAAHIPLGDLPTRASDVDTPIVVMCGHGHRAMTAASLLHRAGHRHVAILFASATEWAAATAKALDTGP